MARTKKRPTKRRRFSKRKRLWRRPTLSARYQVGPLRHKVLCKHKYYTTVTTGAFTPSYAVDHIFRANGMYDPDYSGGGQQPYGFDQMSLMYDHFVVIASKIWVTYAGADNMRVAVFLDDDGSAVVDPRRVNERQNVKSKLFETANGSITVSRQCCPQKFLGNTKDMLDAQYKGSSSGDPTEQCFYHVCLWDADPTAEPTAQKYEVLIQYVAVWIEPKDFPVS